MILSTEELYRHKKKTHKYSTYLKFLFIFFVSYTTPKPDKVLLFHSYMKAGKHNDSRSENHIKCNWIENIYNPKLTFFPNFFCGLAWKGK